jgi:hypothetical protein
MHVTVQAGMSTVYMRRRRSGSARASMLEAWNGRAPSRTDHVHDGHVRSRCVIVTDNVCLRTSGRAINDTARRSQLTAARVVAHGSLHFMPPLCLEQTVRACPPAACLYGLIGTLHWQCLASATRVGSTRERAAAASSCGAACVSACAGCSTGHRATRDGSASGQNRAAAASVPRATTARLAAHVQLGVRHHGLQAPRQAVAKAAPQPRRQRSCAGR